MEIEQVGEETDHFLQNDGDASPAGPYNGCERSDIQAAGAEPEIGQLVGDATFNAVNLLMYAVLPDS
ncbi:hypothetical protein [Gordoniibacillus kamchatkensis]|uniref:hypothetical protein n=1 Tax=Gordoniibacillus kamchatkensis TaxID=1590651 RepID=UPI000695CB40|nr:hypothetical protein [Paenibacillus sp. VKM B-2647]